MKTTFLVSCCLPTLRRRAFTRVELLATVVALLMLTALALPMLGATPARSKLAQCFNNLRQVGRASLMWASEHNDKFPWQVRAVDGGLNNLDGGSPISVNPFIHFAYMSNELATPQVLVCPSDPVKKVAKDFSSSSDGGFKHVTYQNSAQSYFVGLDAAMERPKTMLSGDRNLRISRNKTCGAVSVPATSLNGHDPGLDFTNGVHRLYGQIGLADGSVEGGSGDLLRTLTLNSGEPIDFGAIGGPSPSNDILVPGLPTVISE